MMRPRTPDTDHTAKQQTQQTLNQDDDCWQSTSGIKRADDEQQSYRLSCFCGDVDDEDRTTRRQTSTSTCRRCQRCVDDEDGVVDDPSTTWMHRHRQTINTSSPPPSDVPEPQILSDSKKTSSPRRYRLNSRCHRRIFEITLLIHLFSLFACVASSHFANSQQQSQQPCKNFRFPKQQTNHNVSSSDQCKIWSDSSITDLCSAGTQSRVRMLRHIFLFHKLQPLSLFEIFSVGWKEGGKWQLQAGEKGHDCVAGSINRCTACFQRLSATLRRLDEAFRSFDITLSRFDCLPAVDTASATRPFSPNATCDNCKLWYRRWLLVQTLQIWQRVPCINWCYYTQLACPHLAPAKLWDYAGHPSFQCRDMDIDSWRQECDCVHPCDVRGVVIPGVIGNAPSFRHDFFAAQVHCETRKRECHARTTAHDRSTTSTTTTTTTVSTVSTTTSSSTSSSTLFGFITSHSNNLLEWKTPRLCHSILLILLWML